MILANAAEQTATIDPTLLTLLSIFGAVGVTAITGAGLAIWQSKRDHDRWVRERRYEGFTRILALADRYARYRTEGMVMMARSTELRAAFEAGDTSVGTELNELADEMDSHLARIKPIQDELSDVVATLDILGPPNVLEALNTYTDLFEGGDDAAIDAAKDDFIEATRKTLSIKA